MRIVSRILLLLLSLPVISFSQKESAVKGSVRFDFMVPQPISNGAFKKSFTGIMDLGAGVYMNIGDLVLGVNGRYLQFQVPANKINNTVTDMMNVINPGLSIGYDHHRSEKTMITPGLNVGYNWISFSHISCLASHPMNTRFNAFNLEPFCKVDWMIGDGFGIGVMAAYNLMTYEFIPEDVCLDEFKTYSEKERSGLTQSFSFGFCAYWNWSDRPKADY